MFSKKLSAIVKVTAILGGIVGLFYTGFALAADAGSSYVTMTDLAANTADTVSNTAKMVSGVCVATGVGLLGVGGYYVHHHGKVRDSGGQSSLPKAIIFIIAGFIIMNLSPIIQLVSGAFLGKNQDIEHANGSEMDKIIGTGGKTGG